MSRLYTSVLLIFSLLLATSGLATDATPRTEWKVRHKLTNSPHEDGPKLLLRVTDHSIQGFSEKKLVLDIPAASVLAITSDRRVHRPAADWFASGGEIMGGGIGIMDGCSSGYCIPGYIAVAIVSLGVWLVGSIAISPKKTVDHYVSVLWTDHDVTRQALFQVHKGEDPELLAALKSVTGKDWIDLEARRETWKAEVEKSKDQAILIELDRTVLLNVRELEHGKYMLLALPRNDKTELVFFRGTRAELSQIAGQVMATATPRTDNKTQAPASATAIAYDGTQKKPGIASITTAGTTYLLEKPREDVRRPEVLAANSGVMTVKSDVPVLTISLPDKAAQVVLVNYDGERAFRFPLVHYHTRMKKLIASNEVCRGNLYVMKDRVVFDAALNLNGDRDPFDVKRIDLLELKAYRISRMRTIGTVVVRTKNKRYDFNPYFGESGQPSGKQAKPFMDLLADTLEEFEPMIAKYEQPAPSN